jgi:uncharacterized protein YcfJ
MKLSAICLATLAALAFSGAAAAQYDEGDDDDYEREYDFARVLDVQPIVRFETRPVERQDCREQPVRRQRASDPRFEGGIIDSVLAAPPAVATQTTTTRRCTTYTDYVDAETITGYDVTYRYRGRVYQTVTSRDPGDRLLVQAN